MANPRIPAGRLFLISYGCVVLMTLGVVYAAPVEGTDMAVLVAPWAPPREAAGVVWRADGYVSAASRWPDIIIARSRSKHFVIDLYRSGALLVFNPNLVAGCGIRT